MAHHDGAPVAEVFAERPTGADPKAVFRQVLQRALQHLIEAESTAMIGEPSRRWCRAWSMQRRLARWLHDASTRRN